MNHVSVHLVDDEPDDFNPRGSTIRISTAAFFNPHGRSGMGGSLLHVLGLIPVTCPVLCGSLDGWMDESGL